MLILGHSGTGKTSLIKNVLMPGIKSIPSESTRESYELLCAPKNRHKTILVDTPGNPLFFNELKEQLEAVGAGQFLGIINVVAYGFTDPRHITPDRDVPPAYASSDRKVNADRLSIERQAELEFLRIWLVSNNWLHDKINWLVTIVNKYDLWAEYQSEVLSYYQPGSEYGDTICDIIGRANYEVMPACGDPDHLGQYRSQGANVRMVSPEEIRSKNSDLLAKIWSYAPPK